MGFKSRPISLSGRAWDVSDCARPFVFSAPFQCSTKQGREELLTAAVERAHSDCARSGSTGPSWVSFPILIRRTRFEWNLRYLNAGWPGAASDCARPTRRFCFFTFSIGAGKPSFTARIGRAQFYRARSASKKNGLAAAFLSFQTHFFFF